MENEKITLHAEFKTLKDSIDDPIIGITRTIDYKELPGRQIFERNFVDPEFPFSIELATFTNGVKNAHHGEKETRGGLAMY